MCDLLALELGQSLALVFVTLQAFFSGIERRRRRNGGPPTGEADAGTARQTLSREQPGTNYD